MYSKYIQLEENAKFHHINKLKMVLGYEGERGEHKHNFPLHPHVLF